MVECWEEFEGFCVELEMVCDGVVIFEKILEELKFWVE